VQEMSLGGERFLRHGVLFPGLCSKITRLY
jgi:hypothetical protein